jgi:hypothetical protein
MQTLKQQWNNFTAQMSNFFDDKKELYENAVQGEPEAMETVANRETLNQLYYNVFETEITPYLSFSVGKESSKTRVSFWGGVMITPTDVYISGGLDKGLSGKSLLVKSSMSLSFGFIVGPKSGIPGSGFGTSCGVAGLGYSTGHATNYSISDPLTLPNPIVGKTHQFGLTISNTTAWQSYNVGYTKHVARYLLFGPNHFIFLSPIEYK